MPTDVGAQIGWASLLTEQSAMSLGGFTFLDWIVFGIVLYSVVMSTLRGFIREVLGLATVITGFLLAAWLYPEVARPLRALVRTENLALFLGFSLLFVATLAVGFSLIWMIYRFFKFARLEWFDRLLGGAFGFVRGWLIGAVIFMGLTSFDVQSTAVRDSELAPYFLSGARIVAVVTPFDLKARFLVGYEEVQRWWAENF